MTTLSNRKWQRKHWLATCLALGLLVLLSGCWLKIIDTPRYTQDTSYYCGAASAQQFKGVNLSERGDEARSDECSAE